jgi:DNA gyrase subunit A
MRAKVGFEEVEGRESIIVTENSYQVNKADMMACKLKLKVLLTFEMNHRNGMRIVYFKA